jgi:Family of unknown function (DUF6200)
MSTQASQIVPTSDAKTVAAPVVIDLGKKRRKQVRDLRRGKSGKLLDQVQEALEVLQAGGTVAADAQPIIVVVRERRRRGRWPGM